MHLDADCFYAAVERVRLNIPEDVPLAVQQWSALIAVDYNCRAFGIKRGMLAEDAKKICKNLRCVHVRLLGEKDNSSDDGRSILNNTNDVDHHDRTKQKVSLSRYRTASFKVMNIFQRFINSGDILLRASIDEAYMDLTATCKKMTNESSNKYPNVAENNTEHIITIQEEQLVNKALSVSCVVGSVDINSPHDRLLINAATIVKKIRDAVQNELGYSISAGIASNKLLAKIGSSKNKPRKQTIIPHRHGPAVLANLPVKGVSPPFPL